MSKETTTIEITVEQKHALDDLKVSGSESYKDVLSRLINDYSIGLDEAQVQSIVDRRLEELRR